MRPESEPADVPEVRIVDVEIVPAHTAPENIRALASITEFAEATMAAKEPGDADEGPVTPGPMLPTTSVAPEELALFGPDHLVPLGPPLPGRRDSKAAINSYWVAATGRSVGLPSLTQRHVVTELDFRGGLRTVVPRPMRITADVDGTRLTVVPDLAVQLHDDPPTLLDVTTRPGRRHVLAAAVCREVGRLSGWQHRIRQPHSNPTVQANIDFLALYRRPLHVDPRVRRELLDRCGNDATIGSVLDGAGDRTLELPVLMHLIWHDVLDVDLDATLSNATRLRRGSDRSITPTWLPQLMAVAP